MTVWLGGLFGHGKSAVIQKWCSILVQTHEILAGGSPNSTHKNTPYRLDKLRSALAEGQLKRTITVCILVKNLHHGTSFFSLEYFRVTFSTTFFNISGFWFIVKHWSLTYLFLMRTSPVYKFVMKITKCPEDNCSQRWNSPCALVFLPITLQEAFSVNICLRLWNIFADVLSINGMPSILFLNDDNLYYNKLG